MGWYYLDANSLKHYIYVVKFLLMGESIIPVIEISLLCISFKKVPYF